MAFKSGFFYCFDSLVTCSDLTLFSGIDQCKPYLVAIQRVPDLVRSLIDKIVDRLGVYGMDYVRNPEPKVKKIEHGKGRNGYER